MGCQGNRYAGRQSRYHRKLRTYPPFEPDRHGCAAVAVPAGDSYESLGLDGTETYDIAGVEEFNNGITPKTVRVTATHSDGSTTEFDAVVRIDTPGEADYYRNGGILQYVLRNLMK